MTKNYFDQNVTKNLCNNQQFLDNFFQKNFTSSPFIIITPLTLIELSGVKIKDCLKNRTEYKMDFSDSLINQINKACLFYEQNIKGDITSFLKQKLHKQKQYAKTVQGKSIITEYQEYLNKSQGINELPRAIILDRLCALPLEQFKYIDIYAHIFSVAIYFMSEDIHIPCLRLLIKSYKKLPSYKNKREKKELKILLQKLIKKADIKEAGDLIDTEIIQLAVMGDDNDPLHLFTKDNAEKIKNRLYLSYFLIRNIVLHARRERESIIDREIFQNYPLEKVNNIASLNFAFGKISIVDNCGNITETINAKEVLYKDLLENI